MARFLNKIFAGNSLNSGQFGSFSAGTKVLSTDPATLSALPAYEQGWSAATDSFLKIPRGEEMEGVQRVISAGLVQQWKDGITFWQANMPVTQYQTIVQYQTGTELPKLYVNITGTNGASAPDTDPVNWKQLSLSGNEELNNPWSFGMSQYIPIELDNISWLRSQGQWNGKAVYPAYYDWLLQKRNEEISTGYALKQNDTVIAWVLSDNPQVGDNHYGYWPTGNAGPITSVSGTTVTVHNTNDNSTTSLTLDVSTTAQLYILPENGTGFITKNELDNWSYPLSSPNYCWAINSNDETFRLPVKTLTASGSRVVGNGMTLGLTDSVNNGGLFATSTSPNPIKMMTGVYGSDVGVAASGVVFSSDKGIGVTTDPTKTGIKTSSQDLYLYFYVGETVQNSNLIDAGRLADGLANVIPNNSNLIAGYGMPSSQYDNLTLGESDSPYTAPTSGYVVLSGSMPRGTVSLTNLKNGVGSSNENSDLFYFTLHTHVSKGDPFSVTYNSTPTVTIFQFVYAEGSK